ncbi:hypothetical protein BDV26DRAFT_250847 [Aspergillus bertholletiae]|uniref:Uncharacterized protein n=1 Tax=Aspergillus bertholletiae TaxID=1226010 RepID=A0A5N7BPW6_9EURO|nr:hypothetical protein BDV26DRAFT_250847 [Aspergillus bertholletiae]
MAVRWTLLRRLIPVRREKNSHRLLLLVVGPGHTTGRSRSRRNPEQPMQRVPTNRESTPGQFPINTRLLCRHPRVSLLRQGLRSYGLGSVFSLLGESPAQSK